MPPPAITLILAACATAAPVSAQPADAPPGNTIDSRTDTPPEPLVPELFGTRGQTRITVGGRIAPGLDNNTDTSLFAQLTTFIDTDIEVGGELAGWAIFQNDDTAAVSFSLLGRYHFYQQPRYSLFAEASLGLFLAGDDVPDTGTSFNLLPRIGIGATYALDQNGHARLIAGLHWHHISNARFDGAASNPARDAVGFYVGFSWSR